MSTTYENIATKNAEKPSPCSVRTTASAAIDSAERASSDAPSTRPVPASMNGRRPTASTIGPSSGWQTMPTPVYRPITMPISTSVPPSVRM
jgi:hypothetical protein